MELFCELLKQSNIFFQKNISLARHASFRIGGNASLAVFPCSREELLTVLHALAASRIPYTVIGNASNVLFSDKGFDGVVVFTKQYKDLRIEGERITASAGVSLPTLARAALDASLSGLEFACGIPATLGGAVVINAGAYGGAMSDVCVESECFDHETKTLSRFVGSAQEFAYRTSIYEKNPQYTVLGATLVLKPAQREAIACRMEELLACRKEKQPLEFPSAGSVFKRPEGFFAGKLIEDCGLKGYRIGGAEVSCKHAGFIVNRGGATAADVRALIEYIRERVFAAYGIELECEIRFVGG